MRTLDRILARFRPAAAAVACAASLWAAPEVLAVDLAVRAGTVHTMAGDGPLADGVVLIEDGEIVRVGPASEIPVPAGVRILEAAVVTPGLIDSYTTVGLSGILNSADGAVHDQEQLETSSPIQPQLRAVDAYNAREPLVDWLRSLGVTTVHTGHGPGALVSGQTMLVKLAGDSVEEALFDPDRPTEMLAMTLGGGVLRNFESPGTRPKGIAMLREKLAAARDYARKRSADDPEKRPPVDLEMEALADLLDGEAHAVVTADTVVDILGALRLADEFGYDWVLASGAEAHLVTDELAEAGVAVLLHPPMARPAGERANMSFTTAAKLRDAGVPFAIQSGYEAYVPKNRLILFEAAVLLAHGLSFDEALASITTSPAEILGIDDRVGSLQPGKDADLVLYDGNPFEYTSHVCAVVIDGEVVREGCR